MGQTMTVAGLKRIAVALVAALLMAATMAMSASSADARPRVEHSEPPAATFGDCAKDVVSSAGDGRLVKAECKAAQTP